MGIILAVNQSMNTVKFYFFDWSKIFVYLMKLFSPKYFVLVFNFHRFKLN